MVDGPILGNGDLGIAQGGPPEEQRFYFGKNDFWSKQASPMSVGGITLSIPSLAGGSYRQEQDLANAEVRGTFTRGGTTVKTRSGADANENLAVTELSVDGRASVPARVTLFPDVTTLKENDKAINLGREQHGNGRWYFNGLIDEVHLFDSALSAEEIKALSEMQPVRRGLMRHWGFDADQVLTQSKRPSTTYSAPCVPNRPRSIGLRSDQPISRRAASRTVITSIIKSMAWDGRVVRSS